MGWLFIVAVFVTLWLYEDDIADWLWNPKRPSVWTTVSKLAKRSAYALLTFIIGLTKKLWGHIRNGWQSW